jgi:hypothetical protein
MGTKKMLVANTALPTLKEPLTPAIKTMTQP